MTDKLIVTNKSALRAKYGAAGLRKVTGAVADTRSRPIEDAG